MITAASFPNRVNRLYFESGVGLSGFPGVLTPLPEGDDVEYLRDNADLYRRDSDLYMIELAEEFRNGTSDLTSVLPNFVQWAKTVDKAKIVVGGWATAGWAQEISPYVGRVVTGPCDDLFAALKQEGSVVPGITNYQKLPRYDLFPRQWLDSLDNQQRYGINTSRGCTHGCDFCVMTTDVHRKLGLHSKPLDYLEFEARYMVALYGTRPYGFIADSNFPQSVNWRQKLQLLDDLRFSRTFGFFASANALTDSAITFMADRHVTEVVIGLENVAQEYPKNQRIVHVCDVLHKHKISVSLSYIIDPRCVVDPAKEDLFYKRLAECVRLLQPVDFEQNILWVSKKTTLHKQLLKSGWMWQANPGWSYEQHRTEYINSFIHDRARAAEIFKRAQQFDRTWRTYL